MRRFLLALALPLLLGGCRRERAEIVLAAAGPWREGYTAMSRQGIELAVAELNARAGETPVRIVWRDDGGEGRQASLVAQRLVDDPAVVGVVGHLNSGAMKAAAKLYDGRLAAVATTATAPELSGISRWAFRVVPSDSASGAEMARAAALRGFRRVAILYENTPYGRGLAGAFRRAFQGEIVSIDPIAEGGEQPLEPFVSFCAQRRPDLVFLAGMEGSGLAFMREARRQRLEAAIMGGDGWTGVIAEPQAAEGAYVGLPFQADDPRPAARAFVQRFRARFGVVPDAGAALSYDATRLLAQAARATGGDRRAVRDWLASLDARSAPAGATGRLHFDAQGDPVGKVTVMARVHDGVLALAPEGR